MVFYDEFKQFYDKFPRRDNKFYYQQFPEGNQSTIRNYKYRCGIAEKTTASHDATTPKKKNIEKSRSFIPPSDDNRFIDDPDELLMSVAVRELNKPNPDPRWASILISCKKENITNKSELLDQFKQLPTKALVNLLSKNLQEGL